MFAASWGLCGCGLRLAFSVLGIKPGFSLVLSFLPGVVGDSCVVQAGQDGP